MDISEFGTLMSDKQTSAAHHRLRSWAYELGLKWAHKNFDQCNELNVKIWAYCESLLDMGLVTVPGCEHMKKFWSMTMPERIMKEYTRHE